jgi:hypothetical protein
MTRKIYWLMFLILVLFVAAIIPGCGGTPISGGSAYFDMHYRNPWYGYHGTLHLPDYLGPPPAIKQTSTPPG